MIIIKKSNKTKIISSICSLLIAITAITSIIAMPSTQSGLATIKANGTTSTIGNVSKDAKVNYSTIFSRRSDGHQTVSVSMYVAQYQSSSKGLKYTIYGDKAAI